MQRTYTTRVDARRALVADGYTSGFSSPSRPELWIKGRSRLAVARRVRGADADWVIVPYPEPATATPEQAAELAKRDGIVLNGGADPEPTPVVIMTDEEAFAVAQAIDNAAKGKTPCA